ncbi:MULTISPECIES: nuclear transport factor 2 family protein [Mycolicibacterium]|uniref:Nuclear transport factor 2 family protein n=1 Tax=Mycolicibacterium porcinum TaxID=39693 RepID=A0ABV3VGF8_9MYCO|nr:nuclear transport factor 2 family protein [Mycolicibacterium fortuitum]
MADHPNALVVRRLIAALSGQNRAEIEALIDDNCVWRVPGANVLSGVYEGRPAILSLFGKMKRIFTGPAQFDVIDITASDQYAVAYQYGIVEIGGVTVRLRECLVYRVVDGRVVEVDEFQSDERAFDEAFSAEAVETAAARSR